MVLICCCRPTPQIALWVGELQTATTFAGGAALGSSAAALRAQTVPQAVTRPPPINSVVQVDFLWRACWLLRVAPPNRTVSVLSCRSAGCPEGYVSAFHTGRCDIMPTTSLHIVLFTPLPDCIEDADHPQATILTAGTAAASIAYFGIGIARTSYVHAQFLSHVACSRCSWRYDNRAKRPSMRSWCVRSGWLSGRCLRLRSMW